MEIIHGFYDKKINRLHNTYVTFGYFDGVHRGHTCLLNALREEAEKTGGETVVISFIRSGDEERVLTTEEEKAYYFQNMEVDWFITAEMTKELQDMAPEAFIKEILLGKLNANGIGFGREIRFGARGCGDSALAQQLCISCGVKSIIVEMEQYQGTVITSQRVKEALLNCNFEEVTGLCGHPYIMIGEVVYGKALGRTVGMPTVNLSVEDYKLKPPSGVYASLTNIDGEVCRGLTNVGKRPSVDDFNLITIETFLLDFSREIYGKKLIIEIYLYIRGVVKFDNLEQVMQQVQKDLEKTRDYLNDIIC